MKRPLIFCLILSFVLSAGCWHSKKKPKEITAIATDVEEGFRQRFMEKRTGELVAQGLQPEVARQQALDEFHTRYAYIRSNDKGK